MILFGRQDDRSPFLPCPCWKIASTVYAVTQTNVITTAAHADRLVTSGHTNQIWSIANKSADSQLWGTKLIYLQSERSLTFASLSPSHRTLQSFGFRPEFGKAKRVLCEHLGNVYTALTRCSSHFAAADFSVIDLKIIFKCARCHSAGFGSESLFDHRHFLLEMSWLRPICSSLGLKVESLQSCCRWQNRLFLDSFHIIIQTKSFWAGAWACLFFSLSLSLHLFGKQLLQYALVMVGTAA